MVQKGGSFDPYDPPLDPPLLVDMASSDHRVHSNNDSTSDSTSHSIACDNFTTSRNLIIADIICWAEKLVFRSRPEPIILA